MEVGHQPVDHPELETGMNEERRKGSTGRKGSSAPDRCVFERARGRGSHSDHAPVLLSRAIDRSGGRDRVLAAYGSAVQQRYRFYSYGDAMVIV